MRVTDELKPATPLPWPMINYRFRHSTGVNGLSRVEQVSGSAKANAECGKLAISFRLKVPSNKGLY
jgi:hypothetical protein